MLIGNHYKKSALLEPKVVADTSLRQRQDPLYDSIAKAWNSQSAPLLKVVSISTEKGLMAFVTHFCKLSPSKCASANAALTAAHAAARLTISEVDRDLKVGPNDDNSCLSVFAETKAVWY